MKKRYVVIITVLTAVTVFLASYVFFSSTMLTDSVGEHVDVARASVAQDDELETLMSDIETLDGQTAEGDETLSDGGTATDRDPMVPYKAPPKPSTAKPKPVKPRKPSMTVSAIVLDEDTPTAIVIVDGSSSIVQVGDEIVGGRVTEITSDGITVETAENTYRYPYDSRS